MLKSNWWIIAVVIVGFFLLKDKKESEGQVTKQELLDIKADLAHNLALHTTLKPVNPDPQPDNVIPELADCPLCKGSKYITHADGHKTPCPYHGNANQELEDAIMNLSANLAEKDKFILALNADVKSLKGKLDLIDQTHKPETKLVANPCPCGCNHLVRDCNCVASCPGKRLEVYKEVQVSKPIISPAGHAIRKTVKTALPPYPVLQENRQIRQYQNYSIECSGGSCTYTPRSGFRPLRRIRGWR
jgi:hypothetical protein